MSSVSAPVNYNVVHLPDFSNNRTNRNIQPIFHQVALGDHFRLKVNRTTLDAFILVAYAHVLGMYCGVTDVLLALDPLVLPSQFRLQWDDSTTWLIALEIARVALTQSGENCLAHLSFQSLKVPEVAAADRSPFVAIFRDSSQSDSYPSSAIPPPLSRSQLPFLIHTSDGFLHLHSSSNQFSSSMASLFLRQIVTVASRALADASRKIAAPLHLNGDLTSVAEALPVHERVTCYPHILRARFATDYILPHSTSTPDVAAVQWYPELSIDTVGLLTPEFLSYGDLDHAANRFARFLLAKGLSREDRVAVCMDRDLHFHSVLFGILRAGGCYVPIDPELPTERRLFIARNSFAKFVIVSESSHYYSRDLFGDLSINIHDRSVQQTISSMSDAAVDPRAVHPGNIAYMLYTSGTTGKPKGCLLTHDGLSEAILALSSFAANVRMPDIRKGRYLSIAFCNETLSRQLAIAFDVHLSEIFVPLALGMTVVSAKRSELLESLPLYINALGITHVGLVPSLIDATMCAAEDDRRGEEMKLRYIASGGEKISDIILDKWADHPFVRLGNFYGPSEVTIGCCARFMDRTIPRENIGRAFANVSSYVVDDNLNILPRGVVGELVVAGPLVGRGYHELPGVTAKSFMEWPHPGSWSYRTGDLVRMLPDDTLHIIGRIDTQIKFRGVRIEAEGICAVFRNAALRELRLQLRAGTILAAHPSIGNGSISQLVTFVAWDIQAPVSVRRNTRPRVLPFEGDVLQVLRAVSERELAGYMRPAHIIRLSWLPLNSNGKTDDKTLSSIFREIDFQQLFGAIQIRNTALPVGGYPSPTEIQRRLVSLVENHVKISPIDARISLFAYGMDSLSFARLVSDIRRTFFVSISVADVMKAASIEATSELIQKNPLAAPASSSNQSMRLFLEQWLHVVQESLPHAQVGRVLPPFPIQEGVLYHSDSHPTSCVQHVVMNISDQIPLSRVRDAWEATMKKLDILRTVFYFGRQLVQVILTPTGSRLPWIEQRTPLTDPDSFGAFFYAKVAPPLAKQINSTTSMAPPFRLTVFSTSDHHHRWLTLSIHHALFDGVSLPRILKCAEDELLAKTHPINCSPESLLEYVHSTKIDGARQFWATRFSDFVWSGRRLISTQFPSQVRRRATPLSTSLTAFRELLVPHQVSLQSALTCAFAFSLGKHIHHTDDVAFVVIRAGRLLPVEGAENAICPTMNVLPTRVHLGTEDYLQRVQADISAGVAFEHFPLSNVLKWLPPGTAPFDTLFAVTVKDDTKYEIWDILRSELPEPDFPLSVEVVLDQSNDTVIIQAAYYDTDFMAEGVDNVFQQFEAILLDILNRENCHVSLPPRALRDVNVASPVLAHDDLEGESGGDLVALAPLSDIITKFFGFPLEQLRPDASLVSLGLDSIRSVGLSRVLRQHSYSLSATDIMENPFIRKLAALCARSFGHSVQQEVSQGILSLRQECDRIKSSLDPSTCKLSIDDEIDVFPTTALQTGMISQTIASSGNLYFHSFVLELSSDTDLSLLQNAWNRTVRDLDILRTTFHYVAELACWVQIRHSVVQLDWKEGISIPSTSPQHAIDELFSHIKPTDESSFRRPPIHLRILHVGSAGFYLVLFMHHALYDGLSIPSLLSHVECIYQNQEIALPEQFFGFLPRILYQQNHATAYWTEKLRDYNPVTLLRNTSLSSKAIVASRLVSVGQELLLKLVQDNAVTLQCLAQAAWAKYLASLESSNDVVFGHVVSGRLFDDSEKVVGPMLNTIPCRVQLSPRMSNRELLQSIHCTNTSALPWQHVSLRLVQSELRLHGLLNSLFLFQPWYPQTHSLLWTLRNPEEFDAQIQYPFNIEFHEVKAGFLIKMACRDDVIDAETLGGVLADVDKLVNEIVHHLDSPVTVPTTIPTPSFTDSNIRLADGIEQASESVDAMFIFPELLSAIASVAHCSAENLSSSQSLVGIGVDSITAISLSAMYRKAGLAISVGDIVSSSTIGELASKATTLGLDAVTLQDHSPLLEIAIEERQAIIERFPERHRHQIVSVSAATEGMKWLIAAWERSLRRRFHHVFAYKLSPDINIERLQDAWKTLVACHPILRSTFASAPGFTDPRVVTFALDSSEVEISQEFFEEEQDLDALAERMKTIVMSPLPVNVAQTRGLLLTSTLMNNRYLLIRMHHFQYDAFSLRLLLEDLSSIYLGLSPQNTSDASAFLAAYAPSATNLSEQREYWKSAVPLPFNPLYLPPLIPKNDQPSLERVLVTITSVLPNAAELKKQAQANDLPLPCILLASWASVQASHSSSDHATFGLWQAGRTGSVPNILNLAVPCMNVLPIDITVSDDLLDVARNVKRDLYKRTPVIQQSNLRNVDEWITGGKGLPLTNVFINVLEVAGEDSRESELFTSVKIDHAIPMKPLVFKESDVIDPVPVTKLLQDDVMIDIVINGEMDAITMSIESASTIMDAARAKELIDIWARGVQCCLSH